MTRASIARNAVCCLAALSFAACDDQIKYVPIFSTMSVQPSVEAFEAEEPRRPVPGTVAIDGRAEIGLLESDSLVNPTEGIPAELARGEELFLQFCSVCHGTGGAGDGSVVGANRIPPIPLLNLLSEQAAAYSDGYIWGMITNGRGLMPSYRRIPDHERWYVVDHVRQLQREAGVYPPAQTDGTAGGGE
ncbi:MAG: cytochrome c [Gemmatimonadota bacterium]|nr:cytochrome c [Gemmatimonadota bacterium]